MSEFVVPALAAFFAGALNAVAGGGSFLTFPALVWSGLPELGANATSTVALWPGSLASVAGYRSELASTWRLARSFAAVSMLGGGLGAALVVSTPSETFAAVLPFLLLAATLVFTFGPSLTARAAGDGVVRVTPGALLTQFVVGLYGGYFGGGIGLLMLASFTLLGLTDMHVMNGLKALLGAAINGLAVAAFVWAGLVSWPVAAVMALAAAAGGYGGASIFRRVPAARVRTGVVGFAWVMTAVFFARRFVD